MGHFNAGEAINTVPSNGYLEGTIRTYDATDLNIVKNQMIACIKVAHMNNITF
jgi:metal-dependent amidase/aminoacylase/carboxypeptidase family protein